MDLVPAQDCKSTRSYRGHRLSLRIGDILQHHTGRRYRVTGFSNTSVDETEKFPHTVEYENVQNGTRWSRPIRDIRKKFKIKDRRLSPEDIGVGR